MGRWKILKGGTKKKGKSKTHGKHKGPFVLAVIPATSTWDKTIPGGILGDFLGRPLLDWTIEAALTADSVNLIGVISDNEEILKRVRSIPHVEGWRHKTTLDDTELEFDPLTFGIDFVLSHVKEIPDYVVVLSASTPLRTPEDIETAVELSTDSPSPVVFSAGKIFTPNPWLSDQIERSNSPEDTFPTGSIQVINLRELATMVEEDDPDAWEEMDIFELPKWQNMAIVDQESKEVCEWLAKKHKLPQLIFPLEPDDFDMIAYDFDGVLTDNRALVSQDGVESVMVNRSDGLAIQHMAKKGKKQIIITKERNPVVLRRAEKLGIEVVNSCDDKVAAFHEYREKHNIKRGRTVYFGNDLNDIEVMREAGFPIAPSDAIDAVKNIALMIMSAKGGAGVIREFYEMMYPEDFE